MSLTKIILIVLSSLCISVFIYLFMFYQTITDVSNVKIEGYVYDLETNIPLEGVEVTIDSERFENDQGEINYDHYLGHDQIELRTDKKGHYSVTIEKSSFVIIQFDKENYVSFEEKGRYPSKQRMKYTTSLKKIE